LIAPETAAYLSWASRQGVGGEWLWSWWLVLVAPWTPRLIWVRGGLAGDEMVDWSVRVEQLRPLGLLWVVTRA
jgi:hypothetical protein